MKSISLFISSMSSGGAEHQMSILAYLLRDRGYKVTLVTFVDTPDHYDVESIDRVRIAPGKNRFVKLFSVFKFFLTLKTDCVISFTQRANLLALPALCFRPGIKVIVGERNFTVGPPDTIEKCLFSVFYKRANFIVPNSYSQGNHIISQKPQLKNKVRVITNYTDKDLYSPKDLPCNTPIRVGVFCRYDPQKNYKRFIEAIDLVHNECDSAFVVDWYGDSHSKGRINPFYLDFLKEVDHHGLSKMINANDHVSRVADFIPLYDVLCLPSLYEGFSNSLSEYICCGRPVLASDVSDNHLMVVHGKNGYLFNPYDVQSIKKAFILYLELSPNEKEEMGRQSRFIAESLFDKGKFLESYVNLIES